MNTFNKKELLRKYPVGAKVKLLFMDVMLVLQILLMKSLLKWMLT